MARSISCFRCDRSFSSSTFTVVPWKKSIHVSPNGWCHGRFSLIAFSHLVVWIILAPQPPRQPCRGTGGLGRFCYDGRGRASREAPLFIPTSRSRTHAHP